MCINVRKVANIIMETYDHATCPVSDRCFVPHLNFPLFPCFPSRSVKHA